MQKEYQCTLNKLVEIWGIEPFGGKSVKVTIHPAPENTGRIFRTQGTEIPSTLEHVEPIKGLAKMLSLKKDDKRILVPEHLLGELLGYGIDNAVIELQTTPTLSYQLLRNFGSAKNSEAVPYFGKKLCEALKNNIEQQSTERKILRLEEKIETQKLTFEPIEGNEIVIKVITDYKLAKCERIVQEKELVISPESTREISIARAYCGVPRQIPKWFSKAAGYLLFLSHGFGYGSNESNLFYPQKTPESWKAQELMEEEIACHSILDKLGELSLLPGKLQGIKITSRGAGHKYTIEVLKSNSYKFAEAKE